MESVSAAAQSSFNHIGAMPGLEAPARDREGAMVADGVSKTVMLVVVRSRRIMGWRRNIEEMTVSRRLVDAVTVTLLVCAAACGANEERPARAATGLPEAARPDAAKRAPDEKVSSAPRIVALGDSLTAGLGLPAQQAYPALLQERLMSAGLNYEVVNAGVSGDTSAGGLSRLDWALDGDVRVLIVALGGNDGLRGLPPEQLQRNLAQIIERAEARRISVILAGMEAPPNYGRDYIVSFHKVYPALAKEYHVTLVPFLLQGVAGDETLNQRDGIHPTAAGARIVADNVWSVLKPILEAKTEGAPQP
jgi:acyl-CoA thioesterase I